MMGKDEVVVRGRGEGETKEVSKVGWEEVLEREANLMDESDVRGKVVILDVSPWEEMEEELDLIDEDEEDEGDVEEEDLEVGRERLEVG